MDLADEAKTYTWGGVLSALQSRLSVLITGGGIELTSMAVLTALFL